MKLFPSTYFLRSLLKDIQKNVFLHILLSNYIKLPFLVAVVGVAEGETNSATHFCSLYDWTIERERERGRERELWWEKEIVGVREKGSTSTIYLASSQILLTWYPRFLVNRQQFQFQEWDRQGGVDLKAGCVSANEWVSERMCAGECVCLCVWEAERECACVCERYTYMFWEREVLCAFV